MARNFFDTGAATMHTRGMFPFANREELPVVLLIDDDLVSREVAATLLTLNGYTVHTAEGGSGAIRSLAAAGLQPGVILLDAQMPGLSGAELIAELRNHTAAPVYLISASQPPPEIASAADGFLLKPFDLDALRKLFDPRHAESGGAGSALDPNQPVVNAEVLAKLRQMMPEPAVRQIYEAVVTDLGKRIETLSAAMAKGDTAEVRRIGHAIKGGCGMAGAVQAAHIGALLEASPLAPKDNQLDNSAALLQDLRAAALALERMLKAELPA
jgi:CheY-like chemotaxis protein